MILTANIKKQSTSKSNPSSQYQSDEKKFGMKGQKSQEICIYTNWSYLAWLNVEVKRSYQMRILALNMINDLTAVDGLLTMR